MRAVQERTLQQVMIDAVGSEAVYDELLTKSHGNRCLIILEGLDEISTHWQKNDPMFSQLVTNQVYLSNANILITSRPHACIYLYKDIKAYARMIEIVGFNKPQIREYAEMYFHNSITADKFMEQVNNDPHISSLCYVPLCLNMVLECFKYNNETLHTTLTELYQSFIISKVDERINFKKPVSLGTILENDEQLLKILGNVLSDVPNILPKEALKTLLLLSKLAYKSYFEWSDPMKAKNRERNPKIIYTNKDLTQCNITNSGNDACGLLKATNTLFATGNTAVYTFNHLSVQEYFCALYISLLPEDQQLQLLKRHITDYPHIWPFYAGITKLRSPDVLQRLYQPFLFDNDDWLYDNITSGIGYKYSPLHAMYGKFFEKCSIVSCKNLVTLKCIYEAQLPSIVWKQRTLILLIKTPSLLLYNCMSISYFISIAPITHIILRGCGMGDQGAEILARCYHPMPSLQVLDLSSNGITHKGMKSVVAFIKGCTNIARFATIRNPIGDDGIQLFLFLNYKHLVQLNVCYTEMTEIGACALGECCKLNNSLQSLEISNNDIKDTGLIGILNNLPSTLVQLIISHCNIVCNGALNIGEFLKIHKTLRFLEISENSIGDDGISAISDGLYDNTTLIQLVANSCQFQHRGGKSIAKLLQVNKTLKYLNIANNNIGDDATASIALSIQGNATLVQLNISNCKFHSEGAKKFAEMLRVNETLKLLDISENQIGNDEIQALACGIQVNTTLIKFKGSGEFHCQYADKLENKILTESSWVAYGTRVSFSFSHKGGILDTEGN